MASLASSRPAVDEPRRCREVGAEDTDIDDGETSSGRRSCMTIATSVDDNEDRLHTSAVELELDSRQCTLHQGIIRMTHAPETGAINRLHFLAPVFLYHMRLE